MNKPMNGRAVAGKTQLYLRNRKHNVPCFYLVIETRVDVWENEKCCGNTNRSTVYHSGRLMRFFENITAVESLQKSCPHYARKNSKTAFLLGKRVKCFPSTPRRRNLKTKQSPVIDRKSYQGTVENNPCNLYSNCIIK